MSSKPLPPKASPLCHCWVRGFRDCAKREGVIHGSLFHLVPLSPSPLTCGTPPSTPLTGCWSIGTQKPTRWSFPTTVETPESSPGTHSLGAGRRHTRAHQVCSARDTGQVLSALPPTSERGVQAAGAPRWTAASAQARCTPPIGPLPGEAGLPTSARWNKANGEQSHPTETIQAFY